MVLYPHPPTPGTLSPAAVRKTPPISLLTEPQWRQVKKRFKMTPREYQIARLICSGLGNEEIADQLHVMLSTVKTHIRNIYRKTWVNNKMAMLLRFAEEIQPSPIASSNK
ncbi:MAG: HTH-type transcriptional regulator MalT [Planctomycetes bacterium ADurb.Bin412]|nr:MAG: HTH-type transcriptional regulator MalT [Planctomycetes bacterium ADurb.Bin412]